MRDARPAGPVGESGRSGRGRRPGRGRRAGRGGRATTVAPTNGSSLEEQVAVQVGGVHQRREVGGGGDARSTTRSCSRASPSCRGRAPPRSCAAPPPMPPHFMSLMLMPSKAPASARDVRRAVHALVGVEGQRALRGAARGSPRCGRRAAAARRARRPGERSHSSRSQRLRGRPALVGVHAERAVGRVAHRRRAPRGRRPSPSSP